MSSSEGRAAPAGACRLSCRVAQLGLGGDHRVCGGPSWSPEGFTQLRRRSHEASYLQDRWCLNRTADTLNKIN